MEYAASCSTLCRYFFRNIKPHENLKKKFICKGFGWKEKASLENLDKACHAGQVDHTECNASVGKLAFIMPMYSSEIIIGT